MKVALLDLDGVLITQDPTDPPELYPEAYQVLLHLHSTLQIPLVLVSYNGDAAYYLKELKIDHFFTHISAEWNKHNDNKFFQLMEVRKLYPELAPEDFHFFDDLMSNVRTARALGMEHTLVDSKYGIRMLDLG